MAKFKLPVPPSTTNKCIRMPDNLIAEIEEAVKGTSVSFSAFMIEAAKHALEQLKEPDEGNDAGKK